MIITSSDLVQLLPMHRWTPADLDLVAEFDADATADLEAWLGRGIEQRTTVTTVYVNWDEHGLCRVFPGRTPIVQFVSAILEDDPALPSVPVVRIERDAVVVAATSTLYNQVTLTTVTGLGEPWVATARSAMRRRLARLVRKAVEDNAIGSDTATVEGYTAVYMSEGFTDDELKPFARIRKKVGVSGPLDLPSNRSDVGGVLL